MDFKRQSLIFVLDFSESFYRLVIDKQLFCGLISFVNQSDMMSVNKPLRERPVVEGRRC